MSDASPMAIARTGFNPALNGYRGLCALLVFVFHLGSARVVAWPHGTAVADAATYVWTSLSYGVEMFFMISGFVILGSLVRHRTVGSFLRDRFIRIFSAWVPALVAVTAVCVALDMKMFAGQGLFGSLGLFFANLMLLPPIVPLPLVHFGSWSLTYEWVFYLTAAGGALILRQPARQPALVIAWGAIAVLFMVLYPRMLFFLSGVLVFRYQDWFAPRRRWLRFPLASLVVFLLAWRATGADAAQLDDTLLHWVADGRWLPAIVAFAASLHLFASVCLAAGREFGFLTGRTFQFLGNVSYSFYLWHALVMAAVKRLVAFYVEPATGATVAFAVFAIVSAALGVAVAWLSWRVFEIRGAQWLRRLMIPGWNLRSAHAA